MFQNWLWHLLEDGVDLFLLVVALPEVVEGEDVLVHVDIEVGEPGQLAEIMCRHSRAMRNGEKTDNGPA